MREAKRRSNPISRRRSFQWTASSPDDGECAACSRDAAGSRRCLSRSRMNSSYLAVPGRGGASGGRPPAHCGRVGNSGREPLVDAAASSQRACGERDGHDDGKMAHADWHVRGVAIGRRWIASGLTGCVRLPPDVCCDVAQPCFALPSLLLKKGKLGLSGRGEVSKYLISPTLDVERIGHKPVDRRSQPSRPSSQLISSRA